MAAQIPIHAALIRVRGTRGGSGFVSSSTADGGVTGAGLTAAGVTGAAGLGALRVR
jgi:hypothetical protein